MRFNCNVFGANELKIRALSHEMSRGIPSILDVSTLRKSAMNIMPLVLIKIRYRGHEISLHPCLVQRSRGKAIRPSGAGAFVTPAVSPPHDS